MVGLRGDITDIWKYDVYAQRYYTTLSQQNIGYQSLARIQQALQVTTGATGQPVCIVTAGGCVPYNIFNQGGVTPEAVAFLNASGTQRGSTSQNIISGSVTGDLAGYGLKTPWSNDGFGVALGAEYRKEKLEFSADEASQLGRPLRLRRGLDGHRRGAQRYGALRGDCALL